MFLLNSVRIYNIYLNCFSYVYSLYLYLRSLFEIHILRIIHSTHIKVQFGEKLTKVTCRSEEKLEFHGCI